MLSQIISDYLLVAIALSWYILIAIFLRQIFGKYIRRKGCIFLWLYGVASFIIHCFHIRNSSTRRIGNMVIPPIELEFTVGDKNSLLCFLWDPVTLQYRHTSISYTNIQGLVIIYLIVLVSLALFHGIRYFVNRKNVLKTKQFRYESKVGTFVLTVIKILFWWNPFIVVGMVLIRKDLTDVRKEQQNEYVSLRNPAFFISSILYLVIVLGLHYWGMFSFVGCSNINVS